MVDEISSKHVRGRQLPSPGQRRSSALFAIKLPMIHRTSGLAEAVILTTERAAADCRR
jgi:hypothetical protein